MVVPDSVRVSRVPTYSTKQIIKLLHLAYRAITVFGAAFQLLLLALQISNLMYANGSAYRHYGYLINQISILVVCNVTTPIKYSSTNLSV